MKGLPLYLGDGTGRVIATADEGHNTEFVLDDTKAEYDVGGSAAAAKDDDDNTLEIRYFDVEH